LITGQSKCKQDRFLASNKFLVRVETDLNYYKPP
jgi:hypothetical protein